MCICVCKHIHVYVYVFNMRVIKRVFNMRINNNSSLHVYITVDKLFKMNIH